MFTHSLPNAKHSEGVSQVQYETFTPLHFTVYLATCHTFHVAPGLFQAEQKEEKISVSLNTS